MIELDVDLSYLTKNYNIGTRRLSEVGKQSIDEIMKSEAANGNAGAANFDLEVLKDPSELVKVFRLASPKNRYKILKNMNESDLIYLMQFLEPKELLNGLQFFTKDKLQALIEQLPKEKLAKVVFKKFSMKKFLKMVPEKEIDKFFESTKLDKGQILKSMQNVPLELMQQMMENYTGQPSGNMNRETIMNNISGLSPNKFQKMLKCFNKDAKSMMVNAMVEKQPSLVMEFSQEALAFPLRQLEKPELIKSLDVLEPEDMTQMLSELPQDLMSIVVTQIDPDEFADVLCNRFQDVLADIAAA